MVAMKTTQPKFVELASDEINATKIRNEKILTLATSRTKCDNQKYGMHLGQRGTIHNTECVVGGGGQGRPHLLLIVVVGLASDINDATKIRNKKF